MRRLSAALALGFASFGITVGIAGPLVPFLRGEIPMSWFEAGLFLAGSYLGQVVVVPAGGLADRFGKKWFLVAASLLTAAGLLGVALAPSFGLLLAASTVGGAGLGGYEVGLNALQSDLSRSSAAMNVLHLFFGVGAILGPLVATAVLGAGHTWRLGFAVAALLPLLVGLLVLALPIPRTGAAPREGPPAHRTAGLWVFGVGVGLYVGLETSTFGWLASWWAQRGGRWLGATLAPSAFWIALTLGRLLAGRVADRVGARRFLVATGVALAVAYAGWALAPWPSVALAAIVVAGLACAGVFPTAMVVATAAMPGRAGQVMGFMVLFSAMGGFVFPAATGWLADRLGIASLPFAMAVLAAGMVAALGGAPLAERPGEPRQAPADPR